MWRTLPFCICFCDFLLSIFFFFLSNLCATPTSAIMVRHDRMQYREKERDIISFIEETAKHITILPVDVVRVVRSLPTVFD